MMITKLGSLLFAVAAIAFLVGHWVGEETHPRFPLTSDALEKKWDPAKVPYGTLDASKLR